MMPVPSPALQQLIGHTLIRPDKPSLDSEELTALAAGVYERFASRLTPLIGQVGVRAIFARSARLTQAEYAFLTKSAIDTSDDGVPARIWESFKEQEPAMVKKAAEALLTTFAGLLINLIGERLAWRLLFDVPEALSSGPGEERTG